MSSIPTKTASIAQHIVGFTKTGTLVIGKYNIFELRDMGVSEAVSFYPRLIANGKPLITSGDGGWGRGPRTAVGQKADGTVIFIVIDGRQAHSVGATLKEVQDLFLEEGVINAGNLDGGPPRSSWWRVMSLPSLPAVTANAACLPLSWSMTSRSWRKQTGYGTALTRSMPAVPTITRTS
ncbi:phosphodiester glycosidase family protein [Paenibacillus sp. P25]|nr:phosphodiester glycosidase family protein [Paenibacillus sp. P25]